MLQKLILWYFWCRFFSLFFLFRYIFLNLCRICLSFFPAGGAAMRLCAALCCVLLLLSQALGGSHREGAIIVRSEIQPFSLLIHLFYFNTWIIDSQSFHRGFSWQDLQQLIYLTLEKLKNTNWIYFLLCTKISFCKEMISYINITL